MVLYELLVGRRPFPGAKVTEVMLAILQKEPTKPSGADPARGVSPEWDPVVLKGLEKNPEDRYQTAIEFAHAVRAVRAK